MGEIRSALLRHAALEVRRDQVPVLVAVNADEALEFSIFLLRPHAPLEAFL